MNFRFVTEIFFSESSIPTCEAYLLWLLEEHHHHHRNKFWELGFSFPYFLNQISGFDCKVTSLYIYIYIILNCKWLIKNIWCNEIWVLGCFILFYFWLISSWMVYFVFFQVWLYFEASEILIGNLRCYWVLGFWLQVLRVWISCLSENSSSRIVIE